MISTLDMYRCSVADQIVWSWTPPAWPRRLRSRLPRHEQPRGAWSDLDLERRHAQELTVSLRQSWRLRLDANVDRKSTRLNSSHLVISYAVFCLKKKKKADQH